MNLITLTETLVKNVLNADDFKVEETINTENEVVINIVISEDYMGKLIGKGGRVIKAIRTLVQASSYINDNKKVTVNVESK